MLILVFNDDGKVGADFSGNGFRGKMEACVFGNRNFDAAAGGFQMPVTVAGRIACDLNAAGSAAGFDVVVGPGNGYSAASGVGFDATARSLDRDGAGKCVGAEIAFNGVDFDRAGKAGEARV